MSNKILKFKKKTTFCNFFLKFFIKKGKVNKSKKILNKVFSILYSKVGIGHFCILNIVYLRLHLNFDVKEINLHKRSIFVPFPIKSKRRYFLICKWISNAVQLDTRKVRFYSKLVSELLKIIENQECQSIKSYTFVKTVSMQNRSNSHFRWY